MRTKYYKAAELGLRGPHRSTLLYLPGRTYEPDWLDTDPSVGCSHGLYYASHPRVAARWGPVVLEVQVLGQHIKTTTKVEPTHTPQWVDQDTYYKYRTDRMRVERVVGIAVYGTPSEQAAKLQRSIELVNDVLRAHGVATITDAQRVLQTLRTPAFQLWAVEHTSAVGSPVSRRQQYLNRLAELRGAHARQRDLLHTQQREAEDALAEQWKDVVY